MGDTRHLDELRITANQRTEERDYWLEKLSGELEKSGFPYDYKKTGDDKPSAAVVNDTFSQTLSSALIKLSTGSDVRLHIILAAVLILLLDKYTGKGDIIIGAPILESDVEADFTNTVIALRTQIEESMTFKELLFDVRQTCIEAGTNQGYPIEILIDELGLPFIEGDFPLFDTAILVENIHKKRHLSSVTPGMIFSFFREGEDIDCGLEYDSCLYEPATAGRIMNHFKRLLEVVFTDVDMKIATIDILSQEEKRALLYDFNDTATDYPKNRTIPELFREQVERNPNNIALTGSAVGSVRGRETGIVKKERISLTYNQLNNEVERLAALLVQKGVGAGAIVGLLAERSIEMIIVIFAILKAGGAYLPIEPHSPLARKLYMLKESNTKLLLAAGSLSEEVEELNELPLEIIFIGKGKKEEAGGGRHHETDLTDNLPADNLVTDNAPTFNSPKDIAYIIYTSGTTGKPKGILTMHYNVVRVVKDTNYINFRSDDTVLQLSNYAFDGSVFDIYGALLNGATLTMVAEERVSAVDKLAELIRREKINVFFVTTALFNALVELKIECFSNVRKVLFGGERVSVEHSKKALEYMSKGRILHVYGPTETTVYATYYPIDHITGKDITIPIGRPIANTSLFVLNKNLHPVPTGVQGELYIGGDGLARGYMNRPELTHEKFLRSFFQKATPRRGHRVAGDKAGGKLYKTGDLVRWNHAGYIEFLGRVDTQVKVRGFRIELGEIESRLLSVPGVNEALVLTKEYKSGDRYLCAYVVVKSPAQAARPDGEAGALTAAGLREHLSRSLPDYMVPAYYTFLEKMPLTPNGKIDYKTLPEPETRTAGVYVAPRDDGEKRMVKIWSSVLGIDEEKIGIDDNFFELGGHSLKATKLVYFIQKEFEISMDLKDVFANSCIRDLAQIIKIAEAQQYEAIRVVEEREYYDLSFAQRRLWVLCQFEEDSTAYNIPGAVVFSGHFNAAVFTKVIRSLANRHESLRTVFISVAGTPYQRVIKSPKIKLPHFDLHQLGKEEKEKEARAIYLDDANSPFDLERGPLFRFKLVSLGEEKHLFIHNFHHIINDGWSRGNIYNEIITLYNTYLAKKDNPLPLLGLQYKDYTRWNNNLIASGSFNESRHYWMEKFRDKPNGIELPTDHPRKPLQTFNGGRISFTIDSEKTKQLSRLSADEDVTFFMSLLSLIAIFLCKYSGQEDILIGAPIANRRQPELHPIVGFLVNTLVFRVKVEPGIPFRQFLEHIRRETLESYEYQDYPFDLLVEQLELDRDLSQSPLFNFMVAHNNAETEDSQLSMEGLETSPYTYEEDFNMSKFDLVMHMNEFADCIYPSIEYNSDLFERSTIERMAGNFLTLIDNVIAQKDDPISALSIISAAEHETIIHLFNDTPCPFPQLTIRRMFENQVEKTADKYAVIYHEDKITYKDLNEKANRLAHYLRSTYDVRPNDIIAISMERSIDMVAVLLGIIKAGAAYLALDPTYPRERVLHVLGNSRSDLLVTDKMRPELFSGYNGDILDINEHREKIARLSAENSQVENSPGDILYVNYTSGSTGTPNGAMLSHDCLTNLILWQNEKTSIDCSRRVLQFTSINFCVSFQEIMGTLTSGGELHLIGDIERQDIDYLLDFLSEHQIEILFLPFSYLNFLFNESARWDQSFNHNLKHIITAGEQLKVTSGLKRFLDANPGLQLHNHYGSTEMHVVTSYTLDASTAEQTPIPPAGKPVSNVKIYILDEHLKPVPMGVWGELFVAGRSEILGYIDNDELNREKLVMHPELSENNQRLYRSGDSGRWLEDGNIELRGRKDYLVKVRGFRVELGEIESKLLAVEQVRECVVVDREDAAGQKYLIAYVVVEGIGIDELKPLISSDLPQYMIPKFVLLDSLPLMPNGKVDRERLPDPEVADILEALNVEEISALLERGKEIAPYLSGEKVFSRDTPLPEIVACYARLYRQMFSPGALTLSRIEAGIFSGDDFLNIATRHAEDGSGNETNIVQLFERQAVDHPGNIALTKVLTPSLPGKSDLPGDGREEFQKMTYRELKQQSDRLAQVIEEKGAGPGSVIAILADPVEDMILSILTVLKVGAAYLLIPPGTPIERVLALLAGNDVAMVLSDSRVLENYPYTALQELSAGSLQLRRTEARPPIKDLDGLPMPDRSLVDYEKYSRYIGITMVKDCITILSSRGCPYNCAYCHRIWPKKQVRRSAENIFREVKLYYDMGVRRFAFIDDIFNLDVANSSRFFEMVLEQGLAAQFFFSGGLRGDILTPAFIDLMVKAGTVGIAVALETASPRLQKLIGKNLNVEKLRKNLEYICRNYPQVILEMHTMHGFPSESEEEALRTLDFIKSLKWLDFPYIHMVRIYPNTEMERIALAQGVEKEAVLNSEGLAYHEWSSTSPFEESFTRNYQAGFLNDYFLNRERLLHVLPRQMKVLTEADMVQKYHSYLPVEIKSLDDILAFVGIDRAELEVSRCQADDAVRVEAFNSKLTRQFPAVHSAKGALRIMLLDLSQYFSAGGMLFDVVESPHGLISLLTYLNTRLGSKIHGKIAKARADFDTYSQLKTKIEEFEPDVIGIRTLTFYKDFFHRTVAAIRQWGVDVPIIAGGPYASSDYNTILQDPHVDLVVYGEGEETFLEVIEKMIENGRRLPADDVLKDIAGLVYVPRREAGKNPVKKGVREILMIDQLPPAGEAFEKDGGNWQPRSSVSQPVQILYPAPDSQAGQPGDRIEVTHSGVQGLLPGTAGGEIPTACFLIDGSAQQVFPALCSGAGLILLPEHLRVNSIRILEFYNTPAVNIRLSIEKSMVTGNLTEEAVIPPQDEVEERLLDVWSEILSLEKERISIAGNFFEMGGHSLKATLMVSQIQKKFDRRIPLTEIFKAPTIRELATCIRTTATEKHAAIEPVKEKEYYLLSAAQKRLFILYQMEQDTIGYNMPVVVSLAGELERERFTETFRKLIIRHESLRTSFHTVDEEPLQKIHDSENIEFNIEYYETGLASGGPLFEKSPTYVGERLGDDKSKMMEFPVSEFQSGANGCTRRVSKTFDDGQVPEFPSSWTCTEVAVGRGGLGGPGPAEFIDSFIRPFDLSAAPLLRAGLISIDKQKHILMVDMHHIISDGTSMGIITGEFMALYSGKELMPLRIHYKDYSEWQNSDEQKKSLRQQKTFWQETFAGEVPVLNLPYDYPRPAVQSFAGRTLFFEIGPEETTALNRFAVEQGATLYMVLLSIYNILLSKLSGQEDIIVGTPTAGRRHADLQGIIGMFINTISMRNFPAGGKTLRDFLQEVKTATLEAFENQEYPFEDLVENVQVKRDVSRNPLFDVMFALQNMEVVDIEIPGLKLGSYEYENRTAKFDMTLQVFEVGNHLSCSLEYCTALFKEETILRFIDYYKNIIVRISPDLDEGIAEIDILPENERQQLLYDFNDTGESHPKDKTIRELFEEQVVSTPDKPAVVGYQADQDDRVSLTYSELDEEAGQLAQHLIRQGVKANDLIAILVDRSVEMLIGILGIFKTGCGYVPLNPSAPVERTEYMMGECAVRHLLTTRTFSEEVEKVVNLQFETTFIDDVNRRVGARIAVPLSTITTPSAVGLAYVIFTSGSTGKPKGVPITHANLSPLLHWGYSELGIGAGDRTIQNLSYYFDWSVWEIFITLTTGACLCPVSSDILLNPKACIDFIIEKEITVLHITPSQYRYLVDQGRKLHTLKYLFIGAEKLDYDLTGRSLDSVNESCRVFNMYGPTEATIIAAVLEIDRDEYGDFKRLSSVPIGGPVGNTALYILDQHDMAVPVNVTGELVIGGDCIAAGYLNNPELTSEKFPAARVGVDNYPKQKLCSNFFKSLAPGRAAGGNKYYKTGDLARWLPAGPPAGGAPEATFGGKIEFIGRVDCQVKVRGFRIEPGEIENRLIEYESVKEAVVIDKENDSGEKYLCAYIVAAPPAAVDRVFLDASDLRQFLSHSLPDYMIPSYFVEIDRIPLTANGKLDRRALPEPEGSAGAEFTAPRDKVEHDLASLWAGLLDTDRDTVGIDDNFFESGGHSINATLLMSRIKKQFNVDISLTEIFKSPTVRGIGRYINEAEKKHYDFIPAVEMRDYYPVSSAQKRMFILNRLKGDNTSDNTPDVYVVEGKLKKERFEKVAGRLLARHETLRTSFELLDDEVIQRVYRRVALKIGTKNLENEDQTGKRIEEEIENFIRPFNLSEAPLFRVGLLRLSSDKHLLMIDIHHIIRDGTASLVFIREFVNHYNDIPLPALRVQYKDFSLWQNRLLNSEFIKKQEVYWLNVFSGDIPVLNMPIDFPRPPVQSFDGDCVEFELDRDLSQRVNRLAMRHKATLYMVLLSVYTILLAKYSGQEDIVVGAPIAGRPHYDLENLVGMFVNTLAMRNLPQGDVTFARFLEQVKHNALKAYENQDYQFEELVNSLKIQPDPGRQSLFDTMFAVQNANVPHFTSPDREVGGLEFKLHRFRDKVTQFDIMFHAFEVNDRVSFRLLYGTRLFKAETIRMLIENFKEIIGIVVENSNIKLRDIKISHGLFDEEIAVPQTDFDF